MFWGVHMLGVFLFLFAQPIMPDNDDGEEDTSPQPSAGHWIPSFQTLALSLFNGWALLVFLRDLQHQQRNAWGKLVRTGGVLEYEPVGLVQI